MLLMEWKSFFDSALPTAPLRNLPQAPHSTAGVSLHAKRRRFRVRDVILRLSTAIVNTM
jgi:hypothetical protein